MKRITINSEDRNLNRSSIVVGYLEENRAEKIKFDIPEEYKDFSKKACFKAQGKTFAKIFDDVVGDTLTFTSDITKYSDLDMTIVFFKQDNEDEIIAKTSKLHIKIKDAIICDDDVQPDEPKVILLDQLIETVTNKINEVNNLNIKGERVEDGVNVIFTDKQGNESVQKVNDGESGKGIPQGGNKGQVLIKKSENDYDTEWGSAAGVSIASRENLGVIKIGDNLEITADGVLNALGGGDTEVKVLSGTYDEPAKLYEITEQGKYLINGYAKQTEMIDYPDGYGENKYVLIVLNVNNTIFQYIVGIFNSQLRLKYRIGTKVNFIERDFSSAGDTFEPYNNVTIYNGKQIGEYYGNKYQLTTTDKTSLVNAINEINAKISSGTLATNLAEVQGYDATKTQVLKNVNGVLTWVEE